MTSKHWTSCGTFVGALGLAAALAASPAFADHTGPLVAPITKPGNFVPSDPGDDLQLCFDLFALPADSQNPWTGDIVGFKVDPPGPFSDGNVSFNVSSPDGQFLSWESEPNVTVLGVIVKGGPNYNLYDYWTPAIESDHDNGLRSPNNRAGNIPRVSHYNVCYVKRLPPAELQGCSRGYWTNHAPRWAGVAPGADYDTTFGVDLFSPNISLATAILTGGGGVSQFAAQSVAALLNAHGGTPNPGNGATVQNYTYTASQVLTTVQTAVTAYQACLVAAQDPLSPSGTTITNAERNACLSAHINPVATAFEAANMVGCPLEETRTCKVDDFLAGKCS